ncbi:hypothetical protein FRB95_012370 [Tulasnella sp. JGI-2019a]|nr:hypothetical protein FRB95_012370 [Tulasnella sp. JGI-2019a]
MAVDNKVLRLPLWIYGLSLDPRRLALQFTVLFLLWLLYKIIDLMVIQPNTSALRDLPGPDGYSLFLGHVPTIVKEPSPVPHENWAAQYGPTFQLRGILLSRRLFSMDPRAVAHVLNHPYDYPKPRLLRDVLTQILGQGMLAAEGDEHRRQRKIISPSFGTAQLRELMPIFYAKSNELRDRLLNKVTEGSGRAEEDVLRWLSRMALDVIGFAGFDYDLDSLAAGETNELAQASQKLQKSMTTVGLLGLLQSRIQILRLIPNERQRLMKKSREVMDRVGMDLVQRRKAALLHESAGELKSSSVVGRDLLSILVKANMATDLKDSERMTDDEMMGQINTMLAAGQETTSTSAMWLLYDISLPQYLPIQEKLRAELMSVKSKSPTMEELNALPYLDAVVRENLRINAPVAGTHRTAARDDVIPLSTPIVDRNGVKRHEVRVSKGDVMFISMLAMNRDKSVWGEDALEFKPERWLDPDAHPRVNELPGVYSGLMTFLGGPRHCIGYRFSILQLKVMIFTLIRSISFTLPDPAPVITRRSEIVTLPVIKQPDGTERSCMPLVLKAV